MSYFMNGTTVANESDTLEQLTEWRSNILALEIKGIVHQKRKKMVIFYSPPCRWKGR